jgi:hypothetical protein
MGKSPQPLKYETNGLEGLYASLVPVSGIAKMQYNQDFDSSQEFFRFQKGAAGKGKPFLQDHEER